MKELENLINIILKIFENTNILWKNDVLFNSFNMKKITVFDVYNNQKFLVNILNYREFLLFNNIDTIVNKLSENIEARIKNKNSIQYKIESYTKTHESGNIPLNKCLNDIFGIRIIIDDIRQEEIIQWVKSKYPRLKCINSNKLDYRAIHIYFGKGNNSLFQWELQIWLKKDREKNYKSHGIYKQDYIKWEDERGE